MNFWESILVALENLKVNKMRSFLTIIGIVVGVAAVVTVVSIGQAGKSSIVSDISQYGENFFLILPNYQNGTLDEDLSVTMKDLEQIGKLKEIDKAIGVMSVAMQSVIKKDALDFTITGTSADFPTMEKVRLVSGRFFSPAEERSRQKVVVVEAKFAEDHFGSAAAALHRKIPLSGKIYKIVGIYEVQQSILNGIGGKSYSGYMPISSLPGSLDSANPRVDYAEVKAKFGDEAGLQEAIERVKQLLAKRHNTTEESFMTQTGKEAQEQVSSVFNILQTIIGSIAGISLFVGGIGVMNIMLVSVTERTREIGIRKAIGATPGVIMGQFMIEAVILSFFGGFLGALLGLFFAFIFAQITGWPFLISWWAIFLAFGFSAAVGIFFGLYPANKAARMQPIESLRYE